MTNKLQFNYFLTTNSIWRSQTRPAPRIVWHESCQEGSSDLCRKSPPNVTSDSAEFPPKVMGGASHEGDDPLLHDVLRKVLEGGRAFAEVSGKHRLKKQRI
jgi:hypothetical protein